jgi:disulfide bond formation protein DsbB
MTITSDLSRTLNALGLLAICAVLGLALGYQLFLPGDLPCPLCLLQRVGFVMVGFGLCLNLIYGSRSSHYGIMLLGALYGGSVAARQTLLHIVPGSGSYGDPFLGMHFYVWALITFFLVICGTAVMLMIDPPEDEVAVADRSFGGNVVAMVAVYLLLVLIVGNAVATFLECGPGQCADDPTEYRLLEGQGSGD